MRKTQKRIALDRQHLIAMLKDPEFYDECPAYEYLRETALASWEDYRRNVRNGGCSSCQGASFKYMKGILDAFWMRSKELREEENEESLQEVKRYLEKRKRYNAQEVVLYYRRSRRQGKIGKFVIS